ncbi:hypothetical protein GGR51DRAFT_527012 [Nemania sp. FL0031]|nr:hypothetical protein GGR51DRAFT_527012 [Nemania sp. FL0031]
MDPLTAVGLAGNIVQFVQFAADLIQTAVEIRRSSTGCTADVLTLDTLYQQLNNFNDELASGRSNASGYLNGQGSASNPGVISFRELSLLCKSDCEELLSVVDTLKGQCGPRKRWRSFRTALSILWKKDKIEELEKRLNRTQMTMTLHICTIASHAQESRMRQLEELQTESNRLQFNQSAKFDQIITTLDSLKQHIGTFKRQKQVGDALTAELAALEQQISKLSLSQDAVAEEQAILKSLSFTTRPIRHASIPRAYQKTFRWVYQSNGNTANSATSLAQWLKSGKGVFWVSGKPGSGKSTFMKFIADDPRTPPLLSRWSGSKKVIIASHYFWSAGTTMQKSQEGLLRTLLYEIFRQCPECISVCGNRRSGPGEEDESGILPPWTLPSLYQILRKAATYDTASTRICFFVDGLDEYDGNHGDLCKALTDLSKSPNIKFCLSSRPWNEFEQAFGDDPQRKLYMQDLTRNDILEYTRSRLYEHPRWLSLAPESSHGDWLVEEIEKRACGVFLWVFLATRLLRQGLTNRDSFSDIRRRLESVPVELEVFFRQILESVEPFYHGKMSTTLQMAIAAEEPLHVMAYDFHDQDYDDGDYVFHLPVAPYTPDEDRDLKERMVWWLNSRSRGLLEMNREFGTVTFLHRTVRDFLKTREMSDFLAHKVPSQFNLALCLLKVYAAMIKRTRFDEPFDRRGFGEYDKCYLLSLTTSALARTAEIGGSHPSSIIAYRILEELDRIIPMKCHPSCKVSIHLKAFLREQLIVGQHVDFLTWKLPRDPHYLSVCGPHIIFNILTNRDATDQPDSDRLWRSRGIEMLRLALESQNLELNSAIINDDLLLCWTPWSALIHHATFWRRGRNKLLEELFWGLLESDILSTMLHQGANIDSTVWAINRNYSTFTAYVNLAFELSSDTARDALYLRGLQEFLCAGATINPCSAVSLSHFLHQEFGHPIKIHSTIECFFDCLKNTNLRACNTELLAEVADMLLSTIDEPNAWYVEQVREAIEAAFPMEICNRFRTRYPEISWTRGRRRGKRRADTELDRGTVKSLRTRSTRSSRRM